MKSRRQVYRQYRIPFFDRKLLQRRDKLDPSVVDDDVDATMFFLRIANHASDGFGLRHVGGRERDFNTEMMGNFCFGVRNVLVTAEPISTTSEPARASARAMPRPMPLVDPVTSDTFPASVRAAPISLCITGMFMATASVNQSLSSPEWDQRSWIHREPCSSAAEMPFGYRIDAAWLWTSTGNKAMRLLEILRGASLWRCIRSVIFLP